MMADGRSEVVNETPCAVLQLPADTAGFFFGDASSSALLGGPEKSETSKWF